MSKQLTKNKKDILKAILGISDLEAELVYKTVHILRSSESHNMYLFFDTNRNFLLKKWLHTNSIKYTCKIFDINFNLITKF